MEKLKTQSNLRITGKPIFILGIMPRSGTNFLNNLLLLHPDCEYPGIVWEDYYLASADLLQSYSEEVYRRWDPSWKEEVENTLGSNPFLKLIGDGLILFMELQYIHRNNLRSNDNFKNKRDNNKRLVSATPTVQNLNLFFDLFPEAQLIIIIRDGRAVVESGVKTFNWDYEYAMRRWRNAAQTILQFIQTTQQKQYLVVKYEDLCTDIEQEMMRILSFLEMDIKRYDFNAAANLDVIGSSELRKSEGKIHWNPREKKSSFNSLNRWQHWSRPLHERFNWLAEKPQKQSGYAVKQYESHKTLWMLWNMFIDVMFNLEVHFSRRSLFLHNLLGRLRKLFYLPSGHVSKRSKP